MYAVLVFCDGSECTKFFEVYVCVWSSKNRTFWIIYNTDIEKLLIEYNLQITNLKHAFR